jgi:hypothetical protein
VLAEAADNAAELHGAEMQPLLELGALSHAALTAAHKRAAVRTPPAQRQGAGHAKWKCAADAQSMISICGMNAGKSTR